ncbi:hypothetical protein V5O48_010688 [Marasmius crinis-equi]|uniref:Malate dehydrogenase n=1 Tax=Marasmius crinis-equi TaxID=585013 RepID=A0ABR3F845_9AGAR
MLKLVLLSFVLSAFASPAAKTLCDVSDVKVQAGSLPPQTAPTSFIALGVGTQNYTCSSAGNYTSAGAVATLYDISCTYANFDATADVQNLLVLGQHFFITNPVNASAGISPKWDFTSRLGDPQAFVVGARIDFMPAPVDPATNIDWLKLGAVPGQGSLASEIYRTDTKGGQPPASCAVGSKPITVKYSATYWFTGGKF